MLRLLWSTQFKREVVSKRFIEKKAHFENWKHFNVNLNLRRIEKRDALKYFFNLSFFENDVWESHLQMFRFKIEVVKWEKNIVCMYVFVLQVLALVLLLKNNVIKRNYITRNRLILPFYSFFRSYLVYYYLLQWFTAKGIYFMLEHSGSITHSNCTHFVAHLDTFTKLCVLRSPKEINFSVYNHECNFVRSIKTLLLNESIKSSILALNFRPSFCPVV